MLSELPPTDCSIGDERNVTEFGLTPPSEDPRLIYQFWEKVPRAEPCATKTAVQSDGQLAGLGKKVNNERLVTVEKPEEDDEDTQPAEAARSKAEQHKQSIAAGAEQSTAERQMQQQQKGSRM